MSGRIIYVMGPSGAGKDSVLAFARSRIDRRAEVVFAHRYVSRAPSPGHGNEIAVPSGEFALRSERGLFRFEWAAYGVRYGVGVEINLWAERGLTVVVSGSRAHFAAEPQAMADVTPVLITASPAILSERLRARGRESASDIATRLARAGLTVRHPRLLTIANTGPLAEAGEAFVALIGGER